VRYACTTPYQGVHVSLGRQFQYCSASTVAKMVKDAA
jgi:hypothetical protein